MTVVVNADGKMTRDEIYRQLDAAIEKQVPFHYDMIPCIPE